MFIPSANVALNSDVLSTAPKKGNPKRKSHQHQKKSRNEVPYGEGQAS